MSQRTTSEPDVDDLTLRDKIEYAVEQTADKVGIGRLRSKQRKVQMRSWPSRLFPQWLRTTLVAAIEMGAAMTWLAATATPSQMAGAITIAGLHPVAVGIAAHVWPTRTPPWRTLVWTWVLSWLVASTLFIGWQVTWALYVAIAIVVLVTVARCNANARRLWNYLVRKRIERTFGKGTTLKTTEHLPRASERVAESDRRRTAAIERRKALVKATSPAAK